MQREQQWRHLFECMELRVILVRLKARYSVQYQQLDLESANTVDANRFNVGQYADSFIHFRSCLLSLHVTGCWPLDSRHASAAANRIAERAPLTLLLS
jgi:hypothetical protein